MQSKGGVLQHDVLVILLLAYVSEHGAALRQLQSYLQLFAIPLMRSILANVGWVEPVSISIGISNYSVL